MTLTLVMRLAPSHSVLSLTAMQDELEQIMAPIGLPVEWRFHQPAMSETFLGRVVSVRFKGRCSLAGSPSRPRTAEPLGLAHCIDGAILPFIEVNCDRVAGLLQRATADSTVFRSESSLGRALGRVLAHELYHVLAQTAGHSSLGITRSGMSAEELTEPDLQFDPASSQEIREGLGIESNKIRTPLVGVKALRSIAR